jgi:hypothetical protein
MLTLRLQSKDFVLEVNRGGIVDCCFVDVFSLTPEFQLEN